MTKMQKLQNKIDELQQYITAAEKASILKHTVLNKTSNISSNYSYIESALKQYGLWDIVNEPEKTRIAYRSIPRLIKNGKSDIEFICDFIKTIYYPKEITNDINMDYNISEELDEMFKYYSINKKLFFIFQVDTTVKNKLSKKDLYLLFDNLIMNTIQHNDEDTELTIRIVSKKVRNKTEFFYCDNGKGLDEKYKNDYKQILNPNESTSETKNNSGMGMWIVNNIIEKYNGEILNINSDSGFKIVFRI